MKFSITAYHAVATWKWDTSTEPHKLYHYARGRGTGNGNAYDEDDEDYDEDEDEDDVCGICRLAFESACPGCKVPGDDCPLIWGQCRHIFHMHCLLKWIDTESSKQQCPMDRRPWVTADRKPDQLPTTVDGAPVATLAPGPLPHSEHEYDDSPDDGEDEGDRSGEADVGENGEEDEMEVDDGR